MKRKLRNQCNKNTIIFFHILMFLAKPKPYPTKTPIFLSTKQISSSANFKFTRNFFILLFLHSSLPITPTASTCSLRQLPLHSAPQSFTTLFPPHPSEPTSPLSPSHPSTAPSPSSPLHRSSRRCPPSRPL